MMPSCRGVPVMRRDGELTVYTLHLFSGRRCLEDCHWWMERLAPRYFPNIRVSMLSVDAAVHYTQYGDLGPGDNLRIITQLAIEGCLIASLSGPPCETFSAARRVRGDTPDAAFWPRPLRSSAEPWGIPFLSLRGLRGTGSVLMLSGWNIEVPIVLGGGASEMEHPALL